MSNSNAKFRFLVNVLLHFISKFQPIEITEEKTKRDAENLVGLRNRIASSILIVNGLLVLAVFLIQKHKEVLSFQYTPYG